MIPISRKERQWFLRNLAQGFLEYMGVLEPPVPVEGEEDVHWKKVTGRFGGYTYLPEGVEFKGEADEIIFLPNGRCGKITLYVAGQKNKSFTIKTNGRAGYVEVSETKEDAK